ncbi:MAG: GyrI-like domain-containing protein [Nitrososphaerales archaeon]
MQALDLKKQYKALYSPPAGKVMLVDVPELQFLMVHGAIEPGQAPGTSPGFDQAVSALYAAAYTLKFMLKKRAEDPVEYPVMALEGLWRIESGEFDIEIKDNWLYTLMILTPDVVTHDHFREAIDQLNKKKPNPLNANVRLERFREGLCVQALHVGPYATEPETLERMRHYAESQGYALRHGHHEIYMGDPRRAEPDKLKTVLRYPVEKH